MSAGNVVNELVGRLLRSIMSHELGESFELPAAELLEQICQNLPKVRAAALMSTVPRSKPELPVRSSGWAEPELRSAPHLGELSDYLRKFDTYRTLNFDDEPAAPAWLAEALRKLGTTRLVVCPLAPYAPRRFRETPAFQLALMMALADVPTPGAPASAPPDDEDLRFLGWVLIQLRINWEAPQIARRSRTLADIVDQGARTILRPGSLPVDRRQRFAGLVAKIRQLINCDTCQLFLLPKYIQAVETKQPNDRIWLAAERTANREGLRHFKDDPDSLISRLWREPARSPLNISNLLDDQQDRYAALGKLGLTRHFLGILLQTEEPPQVLGVVALQDKYAAGPDGQMCTADEGFSPRDVDVLRRCGDSLVAFLHENRPLLRREEIVSQIQERLERIRRDISADTAEIYLTPEVIGIHGIDRRPYLQLYCKVRRDWSRDANYARGEGLTGHVFATGQDAVVEDGLLEWIRLSEKAITAGRRRPGKYRVSQHFVAVPIPAPPFVAADEPGPIGVLKIRDRLETDGRALSAQAFSPEDRHLLHAFAHMISVELSMAQFARAREIDELIHYCYLTEGYKHDVVGNVIEPAILNLAGITLPPSLDWLPKYLTQAKTMLQRSWVAAAIAAGRYDDPTSPPCDLGLTLRELFSGKESYLAPDPRQARADLVLKLVNPPPAKAMWVLCDQHLLEIAVLVLPVWLYHQAGLAAKTPLIHIMVKVAAEVLHGKPTLSFSAPVRTSWPVKQSIDEHRYVVSYLKALRCPPINWATFEGQFAAFNAKLDGDSELGETRIEIVFEPAPAPA